MAENNNKMETIEEVEEEQHSEHTQWTFQKYIKSIAHFKWWIIGFSLFGAVAGFLGFKFILNPMNKTLTATYNYNLAGTYTDTDTIRFIDGALFNPYDLSDKENLQKVKDSKEKYAAINIDKLVADGAVIITKNVSYYNENDPDSANINYSINAKASFFPNDDLGKDFLYDLINYARELSTNAIGNYNANSYFTDNFASITFDREIGQLSNQYYLNISVYDDLIEKFGGSVVADSNNRKLYDLQNEYISNYYTSSVQSFIVELQSTLKNKKYVNYKEGQESESIANIRVQCENYIQEIENNKREISVYQESIDKLIAATSEYRDDIAKEIALLVEKITEINLEINKLEDVLEDNGYFLDKDPSSPTYGQYVFDENNDNTTIYKLTHLSQEWVDGCKTFKNTISDYKDRLEIDRQKVTSIYQYCFSQYQNKVNIQNGGYVNLNGAISSVVGALIGLGTGFILTSFVTAIIYVYKKDKKESK